jgi:uncharacterized protein YbjT (DUF2867 family)
MTITVIGATGNVGTLVARGLLAEGQRVQTLVRDPGKAGDRLGLDRRLEINQRAHWNIDVVAAASGIPYATVRPATRTWRPPEERSGHGSRGSRRGSPERSGS